jgi:hypothetical protein
MEALGGYVQNEIPIWRNLDFTVLYVGMEKVFRLWREVLTGNFHFNSELKSFGAGVCVCDVNMHSARLWRKLRPTLSRRAY